MLQIFAALFLILCLTTAPGFSADPPKPFSGTTADAPVYHPGEKWKFGNTQMELLQSDGVKHRFSYNVISSGPSTTYCGEGTRVLEMIMERNKNLEMFDVTDNAGHQIPECIEFYRTEKLLDFPLTVGKKWEWQGGMVTSRDGQRNKEIYANEWTVESIEDISIPAGKFRAFKIRQYQRCLSCPGRGLTWSGTRYYWYAPDVKYFVQFNDFNNKVSWQMKKYTPAQSATSGTTPSRKTPDASPDAALKEQAKKLYEEGNAAFENKDYNLAQWKYEKAIELEKQFAPLYYNLALAQIELGQKKEAIANLKRYLELRPDAQNAAEVKDLIKSLGQ